MSLQGPKGRHKDKTTEGLDQKERPPTTTTTKGEGKQVRAEPRQSSAAARPRPTRTDDQFQPLDDLVAELVQTLDLFLGRDQDIELRGLPIVEGPPQVRRFPTAALAARWALSAKGLKGTYFVFNPFDLDRFEEDRQRDAKVKAIADKHITGRVWLLIDFDPVRPAGTSATDAEKDAALALAEKAREDLRALGWPLPVFCDSGNGGHLMYRIDLPADDGGLVQGCLHTLAKRFDTDQVKVDTSVYNPSWITKLYGTMTRKGEDTADRPHRLSRVVSVPNGLEAVPTERLEALGGPGVSAPLLNVGPTCADPGPTPKRGGKKRPNVEARAIAYLAACQPAIAGAHGHDQTFKVACKVGPGFHLTPGDAFRLIHDHYSPRCQPPWSAAEVRHKIADAYEEEPERGWLLKADRVNHNGHHSGNGKPPPTATATTHPIILANL